MGCPPPADAATLVVNTTADVSTGVGCASGCSLREALATAASGDEIVFASPLFDSPQMILLTPLGRGGLGGLEIATNVTINGPGAHLLTVGRPSLAHLDVIPTEDRLAPIFDISTDGVVVLRGMTITGGRLPAGVGGGIRIHASGATVTVEACHITGNRSTAGGGIRADDDLILIDSTVSNNVASASAGGITATFATITIINSTISGNRSVPD
ncbi:MAG: right-handed parallel beta-helix repeat-containing protein, partial [Candidatus Binatia bacterium]